MMMSEWHFIILFCAIILDMFVGDPDWIWRRFTHPIVWFGRVTGYVDNKFNSPDISNNRRKYNGVIALIILVVGAVTLGLLLAVILTHLGTIGLVLEILIVAIFIAQKSMSDHVDQIIKPLKENNIIEARHAVSMIVGRDTAKLDHSAISRAGIESMSENFSDGVVAPIFWFAIFGLPGLFAYKMINTADSMIGHMNEKYQDFGWASARFDDLVNWLPARLAALFILLGGVFSHGAAVFLRAIKVVFRDAKIHRSPNAGWPEAGMAGILDIALAGPRRYGECIVEDAYINETGRKTLTCSDVLLAKTIFWTACLIQALVVLLIITFVQVM